MKKILLSPPHLCGKEQQYIEEALTSNWITTAGKNVEEFQRELTAFLGGDVQALALNSGTSALHLALVLADVNSGDEVICQSFTFAASANVILYQGATPVFVDSEPETWNINPLYLEDAIADRIKRGKKPKAIVVTDIFGMPANHELIRNIARSYNITVIEDAAEAMGSHFDGKYCGTLGNYGAISFNGNKIITTSGGGALLTHYDDDFAEAHYLASQAKERLPYYEHKSLGYNYMMSNICAGIGRGQMTVLHDRIEKRRAINLYYKQHLSQFGLNFQQEPNEKYFSNYWLSVFLSPYCNPQQIVDKLTVKGIEARRAWKPMHRQPLYASFPYYGGDLSDQLFEQGVCLPSGSALSEDEIEFVSSCVSSALSYK